MSEKEDIGAMQAWANLASLRPDGKDKRNALERRLEREAHKSLPVSDGRRLRETGRDKQMNLKVLPQVYDDFYEIAKERGVSMGKLLEIMLGEWRASKRS
jgi:hypothetical protein